MQNKNEKQIENRRVFKNKIFESAVMICILNCKENGKDYIVLEKRANGIRQGGEISFPGGKKDKIDKTFMDTAIRETIEELGISEENIIDPEYFGTFFFIMGVVIDTYLCRLKVNKISDILYSKDEVEKLVIVPMEYFIENDPIVEEIQVYNKALFDVKKYKFTERYENDWHFPNRKIYIYKYEDESIWGMTAEILFDFINTLKEKGKVGKYEYR